MKRERSTRERMLEAGVYLSLSLVLAACGAVALGRSVGSAVRARRRKHRQPEPGQIDATRHQQIAVSSSR